MAGTLRKPGCLHRCLWVGTVGGASSGWVDSSGHVALVRGTFSTFGTFTTFDVHTLPFRGQLLDFHLLHFQWVGLAEEISWWGVAMQVRA
jgi:hypothetical protein